MKTNEELIAETKAIEDELASLRAREKCEDCGSIHADTKTAAYLAGCVRLREAFDALDDDTAPDPFSKGLQYGHGYCDVLNTLHDAMKGVDDEKT